MSHVDTTSPITHVSLCAGYGGIDLGLRRAIPALRTIAVSEIEAFACANLVAKMEAGLLDPAPIWTDLKTFPWSEFRDRVDILSGGYPCQPFSAAGKRLGAEDPRHLWPHISTGIALMRPAVCFFENVEGHISLGLPNVIEDLAGLGYRTTWGIFSASEVGAPHQRKRVFILAYDQRQRIEELGRQIAVGSQQHSAWDDGGMDYANAMAAGGIFGVLGSAQGEEQGEGLQRQRPGHAAGYAGQDPWPSRPGEQQFAWEPPRVVVDDAARLRSREPADGRGQAASGADASGEASMGNAASQGPQERPPRCVDSPIQAAQCGSGGEGNGKAESPLGRDADGPADWLDDAELFTTCDNRTDELRLLGNGVVPATAERAFRVLVGELMEHQP